MDATEPFPFEAGSFQFVFSEHMIEHVSYTGRARMLSECYRTMRPGGVIRVTTPDLASIMGLYGSAPSGTQRRYLDWFLETFLPDTQPRTATTVINAHFRMWGHQFLYHETTLTQSLVHAGFREVVRRRLRESSHPALSDLENTVRYPEGLLDFESVALEARK